MVQAAFSVPTHAAGYCNLLICVNVPRQIHRGAAECRIEFMLHKCATQPQLIVAMQPTNKRKKANAKNYAELFNASSINSFS